MKELLGAPVLLLFLILSPCLFAEEETSDNHGWFSGISYEDSRINHLISTLPDSLKDSDFSSEDIIELNRKGQLIETAGKVHFGEREEGKWFFLSYTPDHPGRYVLFIEHHYLEEVTFYCYRNGNLLLESRTGTWVPESEEALPYLNQAFPVSLESGSYEMVLHVKAGEARIPAGIMEESRFHRYSTVTMAGYSAVFGFLLGLVVINTYFILISGSISRIASCYIFSMISIILYQAARLGILNTLFWPDSIYMIERFYLFILAPASYFQILLMQNYLKMDRSMKIVRIPTIIFTGFSILYGVLILVVPRTAIESVVSVGYVYLIISFTYQIVLAAGRFRPVDISGKVFCLGMVMAFVLYVIAILKTRGNLGIAGVSAFTMAGTVMISLANLSSSIIRARMNEIEKIEVEARLKSAGYQLMQNRNRPHFLMNTFSLLSGLMQTGSENSERVINLLTKDFNFYTNLATQPLISLEEEMGFIENYLKLLEIRFEGLLEFGLDRCIEGKSWLIPPLSLQPLVENAVKHGTVGLGEQGRIEISVYSSPSHLQFQVTNSVCPESNPETVWGVTHRNIHSRMEFYFDIVELDLTARDNRYISTLSVERRSG